MFKYSEAVLLLASEASVRSWKMQLRRLEATTRGQWRNHHRNQWSQSGESRGSTCHLPTSNCYPSIYQPEKGDPLNPLIPEIYFYEQIQDDLVEQSGPTVGGYCRWEQMGHGHGNYFLVHLMKAGVSMFAQRHQRLRSLFRSLVKGRSLVARFLFDFGAPVPTGREPTSVALPVLQMFLNVVSGSEGILKDLKRFNEV